MRNDLVHGMLESIDVEREKALFKVIKGAGGGRFRIRRVEIDTKGFPLFARMSNAANRYLSSLTAEICSPDGDEKLRLR